MDGWKMPKGSGNVITCIAIFSRQIEMLSFGSVLKSFSLSLSMRTHLLLPTASVCFSGDQGPVMRV